MPIKNINELGFELPDWVEWVGSENFVLVDKKSGEISALCKDTLLIIWLSVVNNNVVGIDCYQKKENWKCGNLNWPKDDLWRLTSCSVIIKEQKKLVSEIIK